jgi:GDP-4-dehydro-6-deoxy-D-mannose reductase
MGLPSPPRILNISTAQVYARSDAPLTESSPVGPDNPYAASKAMAEMLEVSFRKTSAGGVITARSFNHTGPGQLPTFVLPAFAKQFAEIEVGIRPPKLAVGNIDVERDFTDVRDVVRAYSALLCKGKTGQVYNVCSGIGILLSDVIKQFQALCRTVVTIETDPTRVRTADIPRVLGDSTKIRNETEWNVRIPMSETIRDLLDYWREKVKGPTTMEV